jgi:hypothetical protein
MNKYQDKIHKQVKQIIRKELDDIGYSEPSWHLLEYWTTRTNKHYRKVRNFVRKSLVQWINENNHNWLNEEFEKYKIEIDKLKEYNLMKRGL